MGFFNSVGNALGNTFKSFFSGPAANVVLGTALLAVRLRLSEKGLSPEQLALAMELLDTLTQELEKELGK